jgi:hypothetical protein
MGNPGLASTVEIVAVVILVPAVLVFAQLFGTTGAGIGLFISAVVSLAFGLSRLGRSEPEDLVERDSEVRSEMSIKAYSRETQAIGFESAKERL